MYKLFGVISTGVFQIPHDLSPLLKDLLKGTVAMETPICRHTPHTHSVMHAVSDYVGVHRHAEERGRKEIEHPRNQKTLVCLCMVWTVEGSGGYICVWEEGTRESCHHIVCFLCPRWFVYKHSRPLPMEIVRFPPYLDSEDHYRGTTVLPYLEVFYQYDTPEDRANIGEGGVRE